MQRGRDLAADLIHQPPQGQWGLVVRDGRIDRSLDASISQLPLDHSLGMRGEAVML